jgi:CPA1 family monovalent cation:H+ antiporter
MNIPDLTLLLVACVVAIVCGRTKIPYTVGLVFVGIALAYCGAVPATRLSHSLVFDLLLPPLIFEAAFHLKWKELKPSVLPVGLLATAGVVVSAMVAAGVLVLFTELPTIACLTIGIVMSATDPVSVLALLKEAKLSARVHKLLEAESLFNDGTATILFLIAPLVLAGTTSAFGVVTFSCWEIFGGLAVGAFVGFVAMAIGGRTEDHLVEIAITVIAAFGSFFLAQRLHASGILSTLAAGMVIGNLDRFGAITEKGRDAAHTFWEFACFVANSFIFILIGLELRVWSTSGAFMLSSLVVVSMLLGRAVAVYGWCFPLRRTRSAVEPVVQHLLFWGGLRGALSIALVLGLPDEFPERDLVITAVFHGVVFSIVVQGLTVSPLIKRVKALG